VRLLPALEADVEHSARRCGPEFARGGGQVLDLAHELEDGRTGIHWPLVELKPRQPRRSIHVIGDRSEPINEHGKLDVRGDRSVHRQSGRATARVLPPKLRCRRKFDEDRGWSSRGSDVEVTHLAYSTAGRARTEWPPEIRRSPGNRIVIRGHHDGDAATVASTSFVPRLA
jgi:hypothetical protein